MSAADDRAPEDVPGSLSLSGAVGLGTGVMIVAGIFALTGQTARLTGDWFPLAFVAAAGVVAASAYSYVKLSNAFPSSGDNVETPINPSRAPKHQQPIGPLLVTSCGPRHGRRTW